MNPQTNSQNLNKEILTFNEACALLDLSKSYMYKLTHLRKIPHFKPNGKKIYFLTTDVFSYAFRNRVNTDWELQQQAEEKLSQIRGAK
jgi:excisionase family DNA binding protein